MGHIAEEESKGTRMIVSSNGVKKMTPPRMCKSCHGQEFSLISAITEIDVSGKLSVSDSYQCLRCGDITSNESGVISLLVV